MGSLSTLLKVSLIIIYIVLAITLMPGIPPDMEFKAYSVTPPMALEGALAVNNKLNNAEKLFDGEIDGPEHMEVYNGVLYTTLATGEIVKIIDDKIIPIVQFGKKCDGSYEPEICGRPLGLFFDGKGFMYAADAYYGVFKVNTASGEYEQLVSMETEIGGKTPKLPNSLAVAKDGTVYWSDSSSSQPLHQGLFTVLGNGDGRLIKYDPKTKINTVLIDKLHFANGVSISHDESFVVVADLFKSRILKHYLKGSKKGETEVFLDGLPGYPDNIHPDKEGGFFVSFPSNVDKDNANIVVLLAPYPLVRRFLARLLYLLELPLLKLNMYYPNYFTKVITHWFGSLSMVPISCVRTTVVFFNDEGNITKSLHSTDGKIHSITDITFFKNYYYMGSFSNQYLARVRAS